MADGTSVGKIQLDLELGGDIKEQIREAAGEIGKGLEEALKGQGIDLSGITGGIDKALAKMEMAFRDSFDDVRTMADDLAKYVKETMSDIQFKAPSAPAVTLPSSADVNPNARANAPPVSMGSGIKVKAPTVQVDAGAISMQMEQLSRTMELMDQNADVLRGKIKALRQQIEELSKPTGNQATDFINKDVIANATAELQKLELEHDKIGQKVTSLNDKYIKFENTLNAINTKPVNDTAAATDNLEKEMNQTTLAAQKTGNAVKNIKPGPLQSMGNALNGFKNRLSGIGNAFHKTGNSGVFSFGAMTRAISTSIRRLVILGTIARGIRGAFNYFWQAAMASDQFRVALQRVQGALMTAFYPIYQAVMPALISFMNGLAGVINYLAVFISMLFGKTYQASYAGAKALNTSIQAMKSTGAAAGSAGDALKKTGTDSKNMADAVKKSADKAKRAMAGMDEINTLSFPETDTSNPDLGAGGGGSAGGAAVPDFAPPMAGIPDAIAAVTPSLELLKNLFKTLFDPLVNAWAIQGPTFTSALNDAISRAKAIFTDLYNVLQSPPVQDFMTKMWEIVILVGAVALRVFADFVGPLIQWFVNSLPAAAAAFNPVLDGVIKRLENLANPGFGSEALGNIIPALDNLRNALLPFTVTLGNGLLWIYDNVLYPLTEFVFTDVIPQVLNLVANALSVLNDAAIVLQPLWQWLWDNLFAPIAAWTGGVVLTVLQGINDFLVGFGIWITNNQALVEGIVIVLGSLAAAFGIVSAATTIWTGISWLATYGTTALGVAFLSISWPVVIAVAAIAAIIAIGILLWKNWDKIKEFLVNLWESIKKKASQIFNAIGKVISDIWESIKKSTSNLWEGIKTTIGGIIDGIATVISTAFEGIKKTVSDVFTSISTTASSIWEGIKTTIGNAIDGAKNLVSSAIDAIKGFFNFKFEWPKLSMPHFGITPAGWKIGDLLKGSIPKLGIDWYAKGGEFDQPTVIGVGENGREAAVPLENNTGWAADVAKLIMSNMGGSGGGGDETLKMYLGEREVGRAVLRDWSRAERQSGKRTTLKR